MHCLMTFPTLMEAARYGIALHQPTQDPYLVRTRAYRSSAGGLVAFDAGARVSC